MTFIMGMLKRKFSADLLFTEFTDKGSLVYYITAEDVSGDFYKDKNLFDFSDYFRESNFFNFERLIQWKNN